MATVHIESSFEDIAKIVLMPGDPKRCEYIAKTFLTLPRVVNSLRGETAFTGFYKGKRVTVFPSGMGMASMGIYSHELFNDYNVEVIIRIGTAGSYSENLHLYDILLAESAFSETHFDEESVNRSIDVVNSSFDLNSSILEKSKSLGMDVKVGRVHTTDAFYSINSNIKKYLKEHNCLAVEMESFALFVNAKKFHKKATTLLTISDEVMNKKKISSEEREIKLNRMITLALETIITL